MVQVVTSRYTIGREQSVMKGKGQKRDVNRNKYIERQIYAIAYIGVANS